MKFDFKEVIRRLVPFAMVAVAATCGFLVNEAFKKTEEKEIDAKHRILETHCNDVSYFSGRLTRFNKITKVCEVFEEPYWVSLNEYRRTLEAHKKDGGV